MVRCFLTGRGQIDKGSFLWNIFFRLTIKIYFAESVKKTGRCVVSHEAPRTGGFAAEVAAEIQQRCFLSLEAPVQRVCGYDTPFPLVFEKVYLPDTLKVFEAIKTAVRY